MSTQPWEQTVTTPRSGRLRRVALTLRWRASTLVAALLGLGASLR